MPISDFKIFLKINSIFNKFFYIIALTNVALSTQELNYLVEKYMNQIVDNRGE